MKSVVVVAMGTWLVVGTFGAASAQPPAPAGAVPVPQPGRPAADRNAPDRQQRYRITTMERVLEGAVEHGAEVTRERLQTYLPADMLLSEGARVRGFRLEGYGVFFDVAVPSLEGTLPWTFRVLDQNNLGIDNAVRTLQSFIEASSPNDVNVQQAFKRLVMQAAPLSPALLGNDPGAPAAPLGGPLPAASAGPAPAVVTPPQRDPIMENPQEAYRNEVRAALMDVMLDHSRSLNVAADEWLAVAARSNDQRPRLAPMDNDSPTIVIKVRGADLNAYLAGQISREDARKRMDVRVF